MSSSPIVFGGGFGSGPYGDTPWGGETVAIFLQHYPEFDTDDDESEDKVEFSDSAIQYWMYVATLLMNSTRWGSLYCVGLEAFTAHHLVLEAMAQREARAGGIPGVAKGAVAGKSAGDVTVTYDTNSTLEENAGHWNYTIYGQRFKNLANLIGMGPLQVGPDGCGGGGLNGPAWPGVIFG